MIKGIILSLLMIVSVLKVEIMTYKQIAFLLGGSGFSVAICYGLASLMNIDFIEMLLFNPGWVYGDFAVITAYINNRCSCSDY